MGPYKRRLFGLCRRFGFTEAERHDLALILVGHEGSWRTLAEPDAMRLCDVLYGYAYVQHILKERGTFVRAEIARPAPALAPVARRRVRV